MRITVATTSEQQDLTLADELRLVKAALLYADKVTLASPATAIVLAASRLMNVDPVERHRRLLSLAAPLMDPEVRQYVPLVTQRRFRRQFPNYVELKAILDRLAERMPFAVRAISIDNGAEFMAEFETACELRGIRLFVLPPRSPKLHGAVERANRTHTEEFYEVTTAEPDIEAFKVELRNWEIVYNAIRPHQSLGYLTPAEYLSSVGIDV